jgi:hypothetical protein
MAKEMNDMAKSKKGSGKQDVEDCRERGAALGDADAFFEDDRKELYHLKDDVSQTSNQIEKQPKLAAELSAKLTAWRSAIKAPMPTPNKK